MDMIAFATLVYALFMQSGKSTGITYNGKYVLLEEESAVTDADGACLAAHGTHAATICTKYDNCNAWNACKTGTFGSSPSGYCMIGFIQNSEGWRWSGGDVTCQYAKWDASASQPDDDQNYAVFYGQHKWHSVSGGTARVLCDQPEGCPSEVNLAIDNNLWLGINPLPRYYTNCALVATVANVDWTADSSANRMGTGGNNIISEITTLDTPYFKQVFSVTNNHGTDCVIQVATATENDNGPITLESWSLPIVTFYSLPSNTYYYIDQNNIAGITGDPPASQVIKIQNPNEVKTIDWGDISSVRLDGIVYISQKATRDELFIANIEDGTEYVGISSRNGRNNFNYIQLSFGVLCVLIVLSLNILVCGYIGMKVTDEIFGEPEIAETQIKYVSD